MKRNINRLLIVIILLILCLSIVAFPVMAIANPDSISFGSAELRYKVFENVYETGDMLFVAEVYVEYAAEPDEDASEAFTFQVLNVAGDTVLLQRPLPDYQDIVMSIYQTAAQVTAAGYTPSAYKFRVSGNVALFGALTEGVNMVTATLNTTTDFVDQSSASGLDSPLYSWCILVVEAIETEMSETHTVTVDGVKYLDPSGASLFLAGIPALNVFLPDIFQSTASPMTASDPASTGALQTATTPTAMLGGNIAKSVTNMSTFMGVGTTTAGIIITAILGFILLPVVYFTTKNGTISMIASCFWVVACGYLGLFPVAIGFMITGVILILTAFLFWGRVSI